ncbi:hypothetical protein VNI00_007349 [Paramarasmius palmivorus]|uniref:Uncharacterized protein n=1 Tax=Paramarasmius palmivorus TaxID=297713 RepID=A0AAW0D3J7_9AGAR
MPHREYSCGTTGGRPPRKQMQISVPTDNHESGEDVRTDEETGHRTDAGASTGEDTSTEEVSTDEDEAPPNIPSRSLRRQGALDGPAFAAVIRNARNGPVFNSGTISGTPASSTASTAVSLAKKSPKLPEAVVGQAVQRYSELRLSMPRYNELRFSMPGLAYSERKRLALNPRDVPRRPSHPAPVANPGIVRVANDNASASADNNALIEQGWDRLREYHRRQRMIARMKARRGDA